MSNGYNIAQRLALLKRQRNSQCPSCPFFASVRPIAQHQSHHWVGQLVPRRRCAAAAEVAATSTTAPHAPIKGSESVSDTNSHKQNLYQTRRNGEEERGAEETGNRAEQRRGEESRTEQTEQTEQSRTEQESRAEESGAEAERTKGKAETICASLSERRQHIG